MNIIIREAKFEDIEKIAEINIESWKDTYDSIIDNNDLLNINKIELIKKEQETFYKKRKLVATINNQIVGFVWYKENLPGGLYENEIVALYIDIKYRKCGVGKKLFDAVANNINKKGTSNLVIWCLEENYNARKFYECIGGKLINENKKFLFYDKEYNEVGYVYKV